MGIHAPAWQCVYIIDQARGQDGWILAEFSFCVFMDRAWSIKDLLYGIKSTEKNYLRTCLFSSIEKKSS